MNPAVDELDYEEDDLINDPLNATNELINNEKVLTGGDDGYLQLDCSEEDEWIVSSQSTLAAGPVEGENVGSLEKPLASITPTVGGEGLCFDERSPPRTGTSEMGAVESQEIENNNEIGFEINKKPRLSNTEEESAAEEEERTIERIGKMNKPAQQKQNSDAKALKRRGTKKRFWARLPAFRKKLNSSFNEPWLPGFGFSNGHIEPQPPAVALPQSKLLFPRREFSLPPTTALAVPACGSALTEKNLAPLIALNQSFLSSNPEGGVPFMGGRSSQNWCSNRPNQVEPMQSFGSGETAREQESVRFENSLDVTGGVEGSRSQTRKRSHINRDNRVLKLNSLQGDEAELLKLRKEARLKRFMNDGDIGKETKPFQLNAEKSPMIRVCTGLLEAAEVKKGIFSQGDEQEESKDFGANCSDSFGKLSIKREALLQKRNPFEVGEVGTSVKQEVFPSESVKVERLKEEKGGGLDGAVGRTEFERGALGSFGGGSLFGVRSDVGSRVKFVRTVTKSLDELGIVKRNGGGGFAVSLRGSSFGEQIMQQEVDSQTEYHLTGCIVKVLNIPPSTTTNDVLWMCNSIGKVKEVKVNLPKENSAVIRFAEAKSAEKFFSLYHGQKLKDYFLNVIIV